MTAVSTICSCLIRYIKSVHLKDEESIWRRKNATFTFTLPKNHIYTLYLATMHLTNFIFGVKNLSGDCLLSDVKRKSLEQLPLNCRLINLTILCKHCKMSVTPWSRVSIFLSNMIKLMESLPHILNFNSEQRTCGRKKNAVSNIVFFH